MPSFDDFKNKWLGQRVNYDGVDGYQCVDLIRQYFLECYDLPAGGGVPSAINYWTTTPQAVLTKFNQVSNNEAQKGDVVIMWGLPGNPHGHIGIATGGLTATTLELFEQNGSKGDGSGTDGDAIRTRWVPRPRVAGLLRPIAIPQSQPPYTVQTIPSRHLQLNKNTYKYDCNLMDFEARRSQHLGGYSQGFDFHATAIYHMSDGNRYYSPDPFNSGGFHVSDCNEYAPPQPTPYVPPAPPKEAPLAEKYTLLLPCMAFDTAVNAHHHRGVATTLLAGEYFVIAKDSLNNAYNLSNNNMKDRSQWVNLNDNKLEEVVPTLPVDPPTPVLEVVDVPNDVPVLVPQPKRRPVTLSIRPDGRVVLYKATNPNPVEITDLTGEYPPFLMPPYNDGKPVPLVQKFTVDNIEYGRTQKVAKEDWFYGVPTTWLHEMEQVETVRTPVRPRAFDHNNDGRVDIRDITDGIQDFIDYAGKRTYTQTIKTGQSLAVVGEKAKKFIDGYKAKRKVQ